MIANKFKNGIVYVFGFLAAVSIMVWVFGFASVMAFGCVLLLHWIYKLDPHAATYLIGLSTAIFVYEIHKFINKIMSEPDDV